MNNQKKIHWIAIIVALIVGVTLQVEAERFDYYETKVVQVVKLKDKTCDNGMNFVTVVRFTKSKRTKVLRCEYLGSVNETYWYSVSSN